MNPDNNSPQRHYASDDPKATYFEPQLHHCHKLLESFEQQLLDYEANRQRLEYDPLIGRDPQSRQVVLDTYTQDITELKDSIKLTKTLQMRIQCKISSFEAIQRQVIDQEEITFDRKYRSSSVKSVIVVKEQSPPEQRQAIEQLDQTSTHIPQSVQFHGGLNPESWARQSDLQQNQTHPPEQLQQARNLPHPSTLRETLNRSSLDPSNLDSLSVQRRSQRLASLPLQGPEDPTAHSSAQGPRTNVVGIRSESLSEGWESVWQDLTEETQVVARMTLEEAFPSRSDTMLGDCSLLRSIPLANIDMEDFEGDVKFDEIREELGTVFENATPDKRRRIADFAQTCALPLSLLVINMANEKAVPIPNPFSDRMLSGLLRMARIIRYLHEIGLIVMKPGQFIVWRLIAKYKELKARLQRDKKKRFSLAQLLRHLVWEKREPYHDSHFWEILDKAERHMEQQTSSVQTGFVPLMSGALNESRHSSHTVEMDIDNPEDRKDDGLDFLNQ